jgi:hypothetical protein
MARFPACQPIIPYLRVQIGGAPTVEQVLERLQTEAHEYPVRHKQLAAIRFYLQHMIATCQIEWEKLSHGITSYKTLLDAIEHWRSRYDRVCLVTFNYDTMLDSALPVVGLRFETINDYVANEHYKLVKVHGSVDWAHDVLNAELNLGFGSEGVARQLIEQASTLKVEQSFRRIAFGNYGVFYDAEGRPSRALFPALAIPFHTKRAFECPEAHLQALRGLIPETTKLLIVGWHAADTHFVDLLRNVKDPQTLIVSRDGAMAKAVVRSLSDAGVRGDKSWSNGGFTHFVTSGEADKFLQECGAERGAHR